MLGVKLACSGGENYELLASYNMLDSKLIYSGGERYVLDGELY